MNAPHADIRDRFAAAIRTGRLGHAYLFCGPVGVGKKAFAVALARSILCERAPGPVESCGQCPACHLVDAGTHPDLISASKPADKLEFVIESMRKLLTDLALKPARGLRKIAIVEDADLFNEETANCFLKTLEEPPPGSLLLLMGSSVDRQIATIRSRCQIVNFQSLDLASVAAKLREAGIEDPRRAQQLARLAGGSPGLAVQLADADLWAARRALLEAATSDRPDGPAVAKQWMAVIEAAGKEAAQQRARAGQLVLLMIDAYRTALAESVGEPVVDEDDAPLIRKLASAGPETILDRLERLLDSEAHLERRAQLVLLVESLVDALTLHAPPRLRATSPYF